MDTKMYTFINFPTVFTRLCSWTVCKGHLSWTSVELGQHVIEDCSSLWKGFISNIKSTNWTWAVEAYMVWLRGQLLMINNDFRLVSEEIRRQAENAKEWVSEFTREMSVGGCVQRRLGNLMCLLLLIFVINAMTKTTYRRKFICSL